MYVLESAGFLAESRTRGDSNTLPEANTEKMLRVHEGEGDALQRLPKQHRPKN